MKIKFILLIGLIFLVGFVSACHCGDGSVNQEGEQCDSGALNGYSCNPGYGESCSYCNIDCQWVEVEGSYCGDSVMDRDMENLSNPLFWEECDNGYLNGEECEPQYNKNCGYCTDECLWETLVGGFCGDDIVDAPYESCDEGKKNGVECQIGDEEWCTYCGETCEWQTIHAPYCGDRIIGDNEECDEGDENGVLCEAGYEEFCSYCSEDCLEIEVEGPYCGDGIIQEGYEECDGGYECNNYCEIIEEVCDYKNDYDCDWIPNDGDNCKFVYNPLQEDQDNDGRGDVCDNDPEGNCGDWVCNGDETCQICPHDCGPCEGGELCGNWILEEGEECDDGNNFNGDGCSADCYCENPHDGYYCGDAILYGTEECDDGNNINGDGCSASCKIEGEEPTEDCGNGELESGEECDNGNNIGGDGCSSACIIELGYEGECGNGIIEGNEECDDGSDNGDRCDNDHHDCEYCSNSCKVIERDKDRDDDENDVHRIIPYTRYCEPNWECGDWSPCVSNMKTRECSDTNKCGVEINKPLEKTICNLNPVKVDMNEPSQNDFTWWILLVVLGVGLIGIMVWILNKK